MNDGAMGVEHLDEPAHVGALEFLGQIHEHADGGDGVLHTARLVLNLNGKTQAAHAHLVDAQLAMVRFTLLVLQLQPEGFGFPRRRRAAVF